MGLLAYVQNVQISPLATANNGSGLSVTVNNGTSGSALTGNAPTFRPDSQAARRVTITPLQPSSQHTTTTQRPISKVLLKSVNKRKKGACKTFTLRNIKPWEILECSDLEDSVRDQLQDDVIEEEFDVGYLQSNTVVSIRSKEGLVEVWSTMSKSTLWCDA